LPSLRTLDPKFQHQAEAFFKWARSQVPGLVVTSARRTRFEQQRLYQEFLAGRNHGLPVTPPGTSSHELGLAFDMARPNHDPLTDPYLPWLGAAWRARGGVWWEGDPVHFAASTGVLQRRRGVRKRHRVR
jgi:LAS superfamily LD-carboxypeptidase LdcB